MNCASRRQVAHARDCPCVSSRGEDLRPFVSPAHGARNGPKPDRAHGRDGKLQMERQQAGPFTGSTGPLAQRVTGSTGSATEPTLVKKSLLFGRCLAAEQLVAMRETTERADDIRMYFGPIERVIQA